MKLLDLFCGAGGCAMGYHRAGFEVTGVDIQPQKRYPFAFVPADALAYLQEHGQAYDVIHASPPCQRYSRETPERYKCEHSDLLEQMSVVLQATGKPFVIENVEDARRHLKNPLMLCGSMFGLPIWRHRYFEIWPELPPWLPPCNHGNVPVLISGTQKRKGLRKEYSVQARRDAIGCPWMMDKELDQAIPPAYMEWIGRQLMQHLQKEVATCS